MKKICLLSFFLLYSTLISANEGIYFINVDSLLNNTNYGKQIVNKLKNINSANISDLEKDEKELKNIEDEINKVKNLISENELNRKVENLKEKILIYREKKDDIFEEYNNLKNKELKYFFDKITPVIEEYMETNSIKIILEKKNIFIANSKYDITNSLIKFINLKIKND